MMDRPTDTLGFATAAPNVILLPRLASFTTYINDHVWFVILLS